MSYTLKIEFHIVVSMFRVTYSPYSVAFLFHYFIFHLARICHSEVSRDGCEYDQN